MSPQLPGGVDPPSRVLRWFANPWVGIGGSIASVLGVLLAIYFYYAGARERRLTFYVVPSKTIIVKSGMSSAITVSHEGQAISTDVTAAQVVVWNRGNESIRPDNILSPVYLQVLPPAPIPEIIIRKQRRPVSDITLGAMELSNGKVPVLWKILEHNDGAVIQVIYAGPPTSRLAVTGVVEGQEQVNETSFTRPESPTAVSLLLLVAGLWMMTLSALVRAMRLNPGASLHILLTPEVPAGSRRAVVLVLTVLGISSLLYGVILAFHDYLSASSMPFDLGGTF
jgi:hypothetical protein